MDVKTWTRIWKMQIKPANPLLFPDKYIKLPAEEY